MKVKMMISALVVTMILGVQCTFASDPFVAEESTLEQSTKTIDRTESIVNQARVNLIGDASAWSSYAKINANWVYGYNGDDFKTPSRSFFIKKEKLSDRNKVFCLYWNHMNHPSIQKAIEDALNSSTRTECYHASVIVKIRIISDILGAEKMKRLMTKLSSSATELESLYFLDTLSRAFQTDCEEDFQGVCQMSFVNIPWYLNYKPSGISQNHNVIKLSDGRFIGFDPVFFTQPRTYDELERHMYDEFISVKDVSEYRREEHKRFCEDLEAHGGFETFKCLRRDYQARYKPARFDVSKIERFIRTGEL